jgi:hypothetical protein
VPAVLLDYLRRIIGGAVIDDDQLPILVGLRQDAFDRLPDPLTVITGREHY